MIDVEAGKPLSDTKVRVSQFARSTMSQGDFLTTTTDADGRFRLAGAPQGGGHQISVVPICGESPSLLDLENGDLKYSTDFRHIYSAILTDWLKISSPPTVSGFRKQRLFKT